MPAPRRDPTIPEIEHAFAAMSTATQAVLIANLERIHSLLRRERSRSVPPSDPSLLDKINGEIAAGKQAQFQEHEN